MTTTVYGEKHAFCDAGCKESFREDRRQGLIYGPYLDEEGNYITVGEYSVLTGRCAYCGLQYKDKEDEGWKN